ncbi:MAG: hypothetical protein K8F91_23910, partial [Candidatus Obscuribacterales bacterium]|nr:hypothetical protein [Candidatus Obscuribacterales bacterium]
PEISQISFSSAPKMNRVIRELARLERKSVTELMTKLLELARIIICKTLGINFEVRVRLEDDRITGFIS